MIKAYGICLYKFDNSSCQILLGKSFGKNKWGFLKGCQEIDETPIQTAQREFYEECGVFVETKYFENFFLQKNESKDIGIFLVNARNLPHIEKYFEDGKLKMQYQTCENEDVVFFDIKTLPPIKSKQKDIIKNVIELLNPN